MSGRLGRILGVGTLTLLIVAAVGIVRNRPWDREAEPALVDRSGRPNPGVRVRVEVLNGGGVPGLAKAARDELRTAGFDVVYFGNATSFDRDSSVVLDRVGDVGVARAVANALGIPNVRSEPDSNLYLEVSVLLGSAWEPQASGAAGPTGRAWWDPRS